MNRQFKFRVWDFKCKNFYFSNEWFCTFYKNEQTTCHGIDKDNAENSENCITQQFTGLKDKNGKEIFEGDILTNTKKNFLVEWREYSFDLLVLPYKFYYEDHKEGDYFSDVQYYEVIGNQFENPELLK